MRPIRGSALGLFPDVPGWGTTSMIMGLLPFFAWMLAVAARYSRPVPVDAAPVSLRESCIEVTIASAVWIVTGTELLSLFEQFSFVPVLFWWLIPIVPTAILAIRQRFQLLQQLRQLHVNGVERKLMVTTIVLLILPGLAAILSPPGNWDSMTYHLPRQVYWVQQASVAHYPANFEAQVLHPPFAEFCGVHLMILSGNDRFANLVQWSALVMTCVAVSLIARELGGNRTAQFFASMLIPLIPTAYMWASNTKIGLVVAMWACIGVWLALRLFSERRIGIGGAAKIGFVFGLLVLTKTTALFCGGPAVLLIGLRLIYSYRFAVWKPAFVIMVCGLTMVSGHWLRNHQTFGSIVGEAEFVKEHRMEMHSPAALASNLIRNMTLQIATPSHATNQKIYGAVAWLHDRLGLDISDPQTTSPLPFDVQYQPQHEDTTSAPAHFVLAILAIPCVLLLYSKLERPQFLLTYLLIPATGFVLFCLMIKWQPWHTRLHLPLICMVTPAIAVLACRKPVVYAMPVILVFVSLAYVPTFLYNYRPLLGSDNVFIVDRTTQRFRRWPALQKPTEQVADLIAQLDVRSVALYLAVDEWEYPVQRLIIDRASEPVEFTAFNPDRSHRPDARRSPEVMVHASRREALTLGSAAWRLTRDACGTPYVAVKQYPPYTIYFRKDLCEQLADRDPNESEFRFFGWNRITGLNYLEGPYPQWELPAIRSAVGKETTLELTLEEPDTGHLVVECRTIEPSPRTVNLIVNGKPKLVEEFGDRFRSCVMPLSLTKGKNMIKLTYDTELGTSPAPTLLVRRMVLIRQSDIRRDPSLIAKVEHLDALLQPGFPSIESQSPVEIVAEAIPDARYR